MHVGIGKPDPHPVDSVNQSSRQDGVTALARLVVTGAEMAHVGKCHSHWPLAGRRGSR